MSVDVPHGHRGQVGALSDPGAVGHRQGVGPQIVEEVAVDRNVLLAYDTGQHLGENAFGAGAGISPHGRSSSSLTRMKNKVKSVGA
jgi:hypothetical protein